MSTSDIPTELAAFGQQVLGLQGGGALGAYQAGVYEAMQEVGVEPDWVIGTSIGSINGAIIAGNPRAERLPRLREFWARMGGGGGHDLWPGRLGPIAHGWSVAMRGLPGFFSPNPMAFMGLDVDLGVEGAGYYSVEPLKRTLNDLVDFARIGTFGVRLTVGAANVLNSEMRYFDSRDTPLDLRHILASGALPPAFPPVRIDDELYWDGGILSNTPIEAVFDDRPRNNSMIYAVHIWNGDGPAPRTMRAVLGRQKDILYSSRSAAHIKRQRQIHRLRHIVTELAALLPEEVREDPDVKALTAYGCKTEMHVIRLLAPALKHEDHSKDIDFTPGGIKARWTAGREDTLRMFESRPWHGHEGPSDGFSLYEF